MQIKFTNNSILSTHYINYLNTLEMNNNKLLSTNLTDSQISELYNKKYNLTEFEIYKYITALDYATDTLNCNKFSFTEGITSDKNKFNNILSCSRCSRCSRRRSLTRNRFFINKIFIYQGCYLFKRDNKFSG